MTQVSPELQAHLDTRATTMAWCWRLTRTDGQVFGFTDHDCDLAFDGTTFEPDSGFTASQIQSGTDLAVDAQEASGALTSDRITETDILDGRWDGAKIELWRVNWGDTSQRALLRLGTTGQMRRGRVAFVTEVRSLSYKLSQAVGRTYQYSCDARVGDTRCGVDLDATAYRGAGFAATIVSTRTFSTAALTAYASDWFSGGVLTWTSGDNDTRSAEVRSHVNRGADTLITLLEEPVRPVRAADNFEIRAGCDKQFTTCRAKFSNGDNFRGFPHIPGSDTVRRYVTNGSGGDGEVL